MTQLQPHKDLYAIPALLKEACDFKIENNQFLVYRIHKNLPDKACKNLLEGSWEILGEVTKDSISFEEIFDWSDIKFIGWDGCTYEYQSEHDYVVRLLAANGVYFENPYKKPEFEKLNHEEIKHTPTPDLMEYVYNENDLLKWQSFEDKLVKKVLIIQKKPPITILTS